jgi:beta-phosphoglucomutase-like phosphatase (HAD superfamily)
VHSWKPDPGLFLHAARTMGFAPSQCVVVEDSDVGIDAALAAGMRAMHFIPGMGARGRAGTIPFGSMTQLPGLLERITAE